MNESLYRRVLEMYLQDKQVQGEPLPGIKGKVNYKGVSIETGIPYRLFAPGSELHILISASLNKIEVSNSSLSKQPSRVLEPKVAATLTYGELKSKGLQWLQEHNYAEKSIPSYLSHLNAYMHYLRRSHDDGVTDGFDSRFDSQLEHFLKITGKGKTVGSAIRLWLTICHELQQSSVVELSFAAALSALIHDSPRSILDIARAAGCSKSLLWDWMTGDHVPTNPEKIAKLEEVLGVPFGTLSSSLTFYKIQRGANIPKEWWPASWQKHYSNYRHHRNRVIDLIPKHLLQGSLEGLKPTFDEAVKEVAEGIGNPISRQRTTSLRRKVYRLPLQKWPDYPVQEFSELVAYKTAPNSLLYRARANRWAEGTVPIIQEYLESFFGFLCLSAAHSDPELRGMSLRPEDLTLGWLAVPEAVERYLDFRYTRSGAHNGVTESFIRVWTGQLRPEGGWLYLHPELLKRLPKPQQQLIEAAGGWESHCVNVLNELKSLLSSLRGKGEIKRTRETMLPIQPILDHPEPLSLINRALIRNRRDLEARALHERFLSWKLATSWRDHVLISFLARLPLRSKHWGLLTYKEDNSGHLQNHPHDGWRLVIPYEDFKNVRNTTIFTAHNLERKLVLKFDKLAPLKQLIPLLEMYLVEIRPTIAEQGDFLFPTRSGKAIGLDLIYSQVSSWTREYLSQHSSRKLGIEGVFAFGPHAFRDIVATHIIKTTGSISLAANILLDSEEMVRQHYARFLPEDRVGLAMTEIASAFETKIENG